MKQFQDLYIKLIEQGEEDLIEELTRCCSDPWKRSTESETRLEELRIGKDKYYCFEIRETDNFRAANLTVLRKEGSTYYVPNIIPKEKPALSFDEYNSILNSFSNHVVECAEKRINIKKTLTNSNPTLKEIFGEEAAKYLHDFSKLGDHSTGSSIYKERWLNFLIASYKSDKRPIPDHLKQFLTEKGWYIDIAMELSIRYEFALELLEHFEQRG